MRVAVIGAGFSGMLAGYLLEKEGIDVTIYEKQDNIGGHCKTIVSKDVYTELGTVVSFTRKIKELLIDLKVQYTERNVYRNFVDENYNRVEHMSHEDVTKLLKELATLKIILKKYSNTLNDVNFGYIHEDLMVPFNRFLDKHNLKYVSEVITPHLSSFGFGSLHSIQAYYVFKIFNIDTIYSFIKADKVLFINKGTLELIKKLSENISDIRYSLEVINVELVSNQVKVETSYSSDYYDKVLITTKLPEDVIKDQLYNQLMKKIDTNPYITCAYEVTNRDLVTTYYKANLGKKGKIQFFYTSRQNNRTTLVAYAYGYIKKEVIDDITKDIRNIGVNIKQLTTVKQWYIFPHLKSHNLTQDFYKNINERQKISNICLIGSLVSKPSIDNLYFSVKSTVKEIIDNYKKGL
ncbi:NAD(P)/FAD-dependent oxidoreductase [Haloplasma contractile]|uniref:Monoamine oxidase protein n=1 Tax=Haloplasma contractile SSD-17B TaxID=1033810 RepID=U2EF11_9MOLU|nr:NAD(P)/FAD-dependent oxidoreductase [Haloplasma contractile]ERJ13281.1 monoamine oxidase protein [Haloplasma contractile SSD-17B]